MEAENQIKDGKELITTADDNFRVEMKEKCGINLKKDVQCSEIMIILGLYMMAMVLNAGTNLYTVLELSSDIDFDVKEDVNEQVIKIGETTNRI